MQKTIGGFMVKRIFVLCIAGWLIIPLATMAGLQVGQGDIKGRVVDSQGRGVPGTTVVFVNTSTGRQYQATTDQNGEFLIPGLEPGRYTLQSQTGQITTGNQIN